MSIEIELPDLPEYSSYSSFTGYLSCPKSWELQRLMKAPQKPAHYLISGTVLHSWTEAFDRGEDSDDILDMHAKAIAAEEESSGIARGEWATAGRSSKARPNGEDEGFWQQELPVMAQRYVDWREATAWEIWKTPAEKEPAIELPFIVDLGGVKVRGVIDRVFVLKSGQPLVLDIKSGSRPPSDQLQTGIYGTSVSLLHGVRPKWGSFWMGRTGAHTTLSRLDLYTPSLLGELFRQWRVAVENRLFLPRVGSHCLHCSVRPACHVGGGGELSLQFDSLAQFDAQF